MPVTTTKVSCKECGKTVYAMEELKVKEDASYHKWCFKCSYCHKTLSNTNYTEFQGTIYCKPHFIALFKTRGKYDDLITGVASSALSALSPGRDERSASAAPVLSSTAPASSYLSSLKKTTSPEKKDIFHFIRLRKLPDVEELLKYQGMKILFEANGPSSATPIEYAFTCGSVDIGKNLLDKIRGLIDDRTLEPTEFKDEEPVPERASEPAISSPTSEPESVPEPEKPAASSIEPDYGGYDHPADHGYDHPTTDHGYDHHGYDHPMVDEPIEESTY